MMIFLICSDIHGDVDAAENLVAIFSREHADRIILLGDVLFCGYRLVVPKRYDPKAAAGFLNQLADKIDAVRGNCDLSQDLPKLHFAIPTQRHFRLGRHVVFMVHGHEMIDFPISNGDILLSGHTHQAMLREADGIIYANPGSLALPRGGTKPSYLLMDEHHLELKDINGQLMETLTIV